MYRIKLMFEWGGGCLWCDSEAARDRFGIGPIEDRLPIAAALRERMEAMSIRHDLSLDPEDPTGPGRWTDAEMAAFDDAAESLRAALAAALGPDFEVVYRPI